MHKLLIKFILGFIYGISLLIVVELILWIWDIIAQKNHVNIISLLSFLLSGFFFGLFALTPWGESVTEWYKKT